MGDQPDSRSLPPQNSTTERREKNIHALSGIQTHDPSAQTAKNHALDLAATVIGVEEIFRS
jgi:hypothetical protein